MHTMKSSSSRSFFEETGTIDVLQAMDGSASLQNLSAQVRLSQKRLQSIKALLPEPLWKTLMPGPAELAHWVILTSQASVATRLKLLTPTLEKHLSTCEGRSITIVTRVIPTSG